MKPCVDSGFFHCVVDWQAQAGGGVRRRCSLKHDHWCRCFLQDLQISATATLASFWYIHQKCNHLFLHVAPSHSRVSSHWLVGLRFLKNIPAVTDVDVINGLQVGPVLSFNYSFLWSYIFGGNLINSFIVTSSSSSSLLSLSHFLFSHKILILQCLNLLLLITWSYFFIIVIFQTKHIFLLCFCNCITWFITLINSNTQFLLCIYDTWRRQKKKKTTYWISIRLVSSLTGDTTICCTASLWNPMYQN